MTVFKDRVVIVMGIVSLVASSAFFFIGIAFQIARETKVLSDCMDIIMRGSIQ